MRRPNIVRTFRATASLLALATLLVTAPSYAAQDGVLSSTSVGRVGVSVTVVQHETRMINVPTEQGAVELPLFVPKTSKVRKYRIADTYMVLVDVP